MDYNYATTRYYDARPAYRGAQIVWYIANIIEIILLLRFFLRLVGANTGAAFTQFVYNISAPFMAPFQNIIPSSSAGSGVFDWNVLIAMAAYWILASLISHLFTIGRPVSNTEAHRRLQGDVVVD